MTGQSKSRLRRPVFHAFIIALAVGAALYASLTSRGHTQLVNGSAALEASTAFEGSGGHFGAHLAGIPDQAAASTSAGSSQPQQATLAFAPGLADVLTRAQGGPTVAPNTAEVSGTQASAPSVSPNPATGLNPPSLATPTPALPPCDTAQSAIYCVYTIQAGDTLSGIAARFGVQPPAGSDLTASEMLALSNKPDIVSEEDVLQPGQKLRVPRGNGIVHNVTVDTTLSDIASLYGVTVDSIIRTNALNDPDLIAIGSEVLVPDPKTYSPPVEAVAQPSATATPEDSAAAGSDSSAAPATGAGNSDSGSGSSGSASPAAQATKAPAASSSGFIWPVTGPITSYFGPSHPLGIDIGLGPKGTGIPIAAAMGGTVSFAGGNPCCSYGYYVVIDHGNGLQTLYGHLSRIEVSVGEKVSQGEEIGRSGTTGYSTGPHLHFEVHLNGKVVNPLSYLP